ncbi:MAG TPA: hypothetical protein VJ963_00290, partial [Bacteroidales bacterium]|nr:hypothetical protein [Bacteroidales bacterium]
MKTLSAIVVFLIAFSSVNAQDNTSKADSLQKVLASVGKNDTTAQYSLFKQLYDIYIIDDLPAALSIAQKQYLLAKNQNDITREGEAAGWLGNTYYGQGKNDSSLFFLNKALESYRIKPDKEKEADILNNIANVFRVTARY